MKKIFTLIAVAAMALSANAQGKYAMTSGEAHAFGDKITSVANIQMIFGNTLNPGSNAGFTGAEEDTNLTEKGWSYYTKGNGVNGNKDGGTIYVFKPAIAGKLTVAVVLNAGKAFHISEDGTDMEGYAGITVDPKYYGTYSVNVKAGSTYMVWCDGSKLGFYGFEFTTGSGIEAVKGVKAAFKGATYNVAGQQVDAAAKGLVIKDGKKIINK